MNIGYRGYMASASGIGQLIAGVAMAATLGNAAAQIASSGQGLLRPASQLQPGQVGTALQIQVYSKSIEGNLSGDPALRDVSIYLPPSYATNPTRRYPVLYMLHDAGGTHLRYFAPNSATHIPTIANRTLQARTSSEMIIVSPNANSLYGGSNYSSGAATGDYESFISKDLVEYIDTNFRTIARREGRGLAGHSMGGYGTWRIAMKHPDVYAAFYVMSSCCISPTSNLSTDPGTISAFETWYNGSIAAGAILPRPGSITTNVQAAAAWAPNPTRAPLYFDLPFQGGQQVRAVVDRMTTNRPLTMVDQYIGALRQMAIGFDVGNEDTNIMNNLIDMSAVLTSYQIPHKFEIYQGNHGNRIPVRFETKVLPFFTRQFQALPSN